MSTISTKLATLKAKTADLVVKEVKLPESAADPLALFESNSAAKSDSANEWIIDLFPSQIIIFTYLLTLASQYSALIDHKDHAKSSTPIVAMYLMTLYHAFFLLNDLHVRPTPSAHARSWSETSWKYEFAQFLLTLPVPTSMETIFAQLYATQTDRTNNIFLIPSATGFQHDIHYGRFIPLSFFTHIHDCIATMPGNSTRLAIMNDLLPRVLYKLRPTAGTAFDSVLADILGVTATGNANATGHYCASKFYQKFTSVFNPVLFRDFHRRSSLATIDLAVPSFRTLYPNAYDVLFSATSMNLPELKTVLQSMSSLLSGSVPMSKNLCQIISSASGTNAFAHGYSTFALPTWSSNMNLPAGNAFPPLTTLTAQTPTERSSSISFLQPPAARPAAATDITDVDLAGTTPSVSARYWPFSLLNQIDSPTPYPHTTQFVTFTDDTEKDHTYPKVLILDISGSKTVSAHLATLTGKIIESFELDGTTIEIPRADKSLGLQNALFADSAIPYKYVLRSLRFYPRDAGTILLPLQRSRPVSTARLPASSLLHDRTTVFLPRLNKRIIDAPVPRSIPGLSPLADYDWIRYVQSFLGFRTVTRQSNTDALDSVNSMENGRLYLFSPYSYTPYEDQDSDSLAPDMSASRHYFLSNLRTIFGTDYNLVEVNHPLEAMPVM
nr:capsid protein [Sarcosphaera coronaria partitivirus]